MDLVVIEAPGKLASLRRALETNGVRARVVATIGHLRGYRRRLDPLGITLSAGEPDRIEDRPILRPNVRKFLANAIGSADRILIATDADQEGHAIAQDVADLAQEVAPSRPLLRMLTPGMDVASVNAALRHLTALEPTAAMPGIARRIADRTFAAGYSDPAAGRVIGRVQAGLLHLCQQGAVRRRVAIGAVACANGGAPFTARVEVPAHVNDDQVARVFAGARAVPVSVSQTVLRTPMDGADALLGLEAELGLSIDQAADLLQEMYEQGRITYPRTAARAYTGLGVAGAAHLAQVRSIMRFQERAVPRLEDGAHEALRITSQSRQGDRLGPDLMRPPRLYGNASDGVITIIGRSMIESGVPVTRTQGKVEDLPGWAAGMVVERDTGRSGVPWRDSTPPALRVRERSPEAAVVAAMAAAGVGRPSTYARHARRLVDSGWVDEQLQLTPAGERALEAVPPITRQAAASPAFERAMEAAGPVPERVASALAALACEDAIAQAPWRSCGDLADAPDRDETAQLDDPGPDELLYEDEEDAPAYRMV